MRRADREMMTWREQGEHQGWSGGGAIRRCGTGGFTGAGRRRLQDGSRFGADGARARLVGHRRGAGATYCCSNVSVGERPIIQRRDRVGANTPGGLGAERMRRVHRGAVGAWVTVRLDRLPGDLAGDGVCDWADRGIHVTRTAAAIGCRGSLIVSLLFSQARSGRSHCSPNWGKRFAALGSKGATATVRGDKCKYNGSGVRFSSAHFASYW